MRDRPRAARARRRRRYRHASIPAAQCGASATASDLTPELLEAGRRRAEAEGLQLEWVEGDAEHLPFDDESFDVVMSSIGAMFAPTTARSPTSWSACAVRAARSGC